MSMSDARKRANRKWVEKSYDRIGIVLKKGEREEIADFAKQNGESINGFINRAIKEAMGKEFTSDDYGVGGTY